MRRRKSTIQTTRDAMKRAALSRVRSNPDAGPKTGSARPLPQPPVKAGRARRLPKPPTY